jgi:hypothetical protein
MKKYFKNLILSIRRKLFLRKMRGKSGIITMRLHPDSPPVKRGDMLKYVAMDGSDRNGMVVSAVNVDAESIKPHIHFSYFDNLAGIEEIYRIDDSDS